MKLFKTGPYTIKAADAASAITFAQVELDADPDDADDLYELPLDTIVSVYADEENVVEIGDVPPQRKSVAEWLEHPSIQSLVAPALAWSEEY